MTQYSTKLFSYKGNQFSADASTLQIASGVVLREIDLVSERTGDILRFRYHSEKFYPACDPSYWCYYSDALPGIGKQSVIIFND